MASRAAFVKNRAQTASRTAQSCLAAAMKKKKKKTADAADAATGLSAAHCGAR
jgi:hypothetical protein